MYVRLSKNIYILYRSIQGLTKSERYILRKKKRERNLFISISKEELINKYYQQKINSEKWNDYYCQNKLNNLINKSDIKYNIQNNKINHNKQLLPTIKNNLNNNIYYQRQIHSWDIPDDNNYFTKIIIIFYLPFKQTKSHSLDNKQQIIFNDYLNIPSSFFTIKEIKKQNERKKDFLGKKLNKWTKYDEESLSYLKKKILAPLSRRGKEINIFFDTGFLKILLIAHMF
ncbi:hypothetical protein Mgra_00003154 [Meloidogyne graminicola]|uniref:Uncharacterized protein n=1 Tax=Meloidogyne graminicola TaxID=189291 RepID=A0A8S9ZVX1_9BILA|nr:hypothetical protein Mgra_00003154 [Meloidogyne graminicola]